MREGSGVSLLVATGGEDAGGGVVFAEGLEGGDGLEAGAHAHAFAEGAGGLRVFPE
jgi:hypothetical protein